MFISTSGYAELLLGIPIAFNFNCYRVYVRKSHSVGSVCSSVRYSCCLFVALTVRECYALVRMRYAILSRQTYRRVEVLRSIV